MNLFAVSKDFLSTLKCLVEWFQDNASEPSGNPNPDAKSTGSLFKARKEGDPSDCDWDWPSFQKVILCEKKAARKVAPGY